jgi:hypothetical protein
VAGRDRIHPAKAGRRSAANGGRGKWKVAAVRAEDTVAPAPAGMVVIPSGNYAPLIRTKDEPERVPVAAGYRDERLVANAECLSFFRANPKWPRSRVSRLLAEVGYLVTWAGDTALGPRVSAASPVVRIRWFAACADPAWTGQRRPTTSPNRSGLPPRDFPRRMAGRSRAFARRLWRGLPNRQRTRCPSSVSAGPILRCRRSARARVGVS